MLTISAKNVTLPREEWRADVGGTALLLPQVRIQQAPLASALRRMSSFTAAWRVPFKHGQHRGAGSCVRHEASLD